MSEDALHQLEKEVAKAKRIASDWASQIHDLVEDRFPSAYQELPGLSQSAYEAGQKWADLNRQLQALKKELAA